MTTPDTKTSFQYVDYNWDNAKAAALGDDQVALFLYRSNTLGADLRITNYGGGNPSCKTWETDPLTGERVEVMWIKGFSVPMSPLASSLICSIQVPAGFLSFRSARLPSG